MRPREKTIARWLEYLASLGLSVYGPNVDVEDGEMMPGCRDYDAAAIVKLRRHIEQDTLYRGADS